MKAAVCRAFGAPLEIEELRLDAPEDGELTVDLAACAICHSDIAFAEGAWGGDLPAVYGHEAAGVVREVGEGVSDIRPGARVVVSLMRSCGRCYFCERGDFHLCAGEFLGDRKARLHTEAGEPVVQAMHTGAFAEQVVVHESQVAAVPASLPLDVASLLGCGVITGVGAVLDRADVAPGSSVVVVGTGGVGLNAVQGARAAGAEIVVAVDTSPSKLVVAASFGATRTVDPGEEDTAAAVRSLTGGRGADYVFVGVGSGGHRGRARTRQAWRDGRRPRHARCRTRPSASSESTSSTTTSASSATRSARGRAGSRMSSPGWSSSTTRAG